MLWKPPASFSWPYKGRREGWSGLATFLTYRQRLKRLCRSARKFQEMKPMVWCSTQLIQGTSLSNWSMLKSRSIICTEVSSGRTSWLYRFSTRGSLCYPILDWFSSVMFVFCSSLFSSPPYSPSSLISSSLQVTGGPISARETFETIRPRSSKHQKNSFPIAAAGATVSLAYLGFSLTCLRSVCWLLTICP